MFYKQERTRSTGHWLTCSQGSSCALRDTGLAGNLRHWEMWWHFKLLFIFKKDGVQLSLCKRPFLPQRSTELKAKQDD